MKALTKDTQNIGKQLSGIGKDLTAAITLPIAGIAAGVIKMGSEFETQMSQLQAVTHGSAKTMADFKNEAMDLGTKTKYSATEAVEAMDELAKAGVKSNDVMKAVPATLTLAAAGHIELGDAAAIAAREMNEFGMKATDMNHVADVIAYTTTHAHTSVDELSQAMVPAGGFAHQLGMSYEDLNASLGVMSKAGLNGRDAGQKMVAMLRAMAAPSAKAAKEQKALGLEFFDAQGHMKTMPQIIDMINKKTAGMGDQARFAALKIAFTSAGMQGLLPLLRHGGDELQNFSNHLKNSNGYAQKTADIMNNNLQGSLKRLQSQFQNAAISIYTNFGPALAKIVNGISKLVGSFSKMSPEQQRSIMLWAAVAASFGPVLIMAGKAVMIFGKVRAAIMLAKEAQTAWGVASALMGGPVGMIAIAIMGLIAITVFLVTHWKEVKKLAEQVWGAISKFFVKVGNDIGHGLEAAWKYVKSATITAFNAVVAFFKKWGLDILAVLLGPIAILALIIYQNWDAIVKTTQTIWNGIVNWLANLWKTIADGAQAGWTAVSKSTVSIWNSIVAFLTGVWNGIIAFVTPIWNGLVAVFTAVWNGIVVVTTAVWNYIWQYLVALWTAFLYFATPVFNQLVAFLTKIWNDVKTGAMVVWNMIVAYLTQTWNALVAGAMMIWNPIATFFTALWNGIQAVSRTVWLTLAAFYNATWNAIKSAAITVWTAVSSFFTATWNTIKSIATTVWSSISSFFTSTWNSIKSQAVSIWNSVVTAIEGPINRVKSTATSSLNSMKSTISGIWSEIKSTASSMWSGIESSVSGAVNRMRSAVGSAFSGLRSVAVGAWEGIKSGIHSVINSIIGLVNHFIDGFNAPARALNKIPGVHAPSIGHIPALATGGTIMGSGMALVGEAGPELISKSGSSVKVTPLSSSEKARGIGGALGGSGGGFSGTIEVPVVIDGRTIAKVVAPFMDKALRDRSASLSRAKGGSQ